MTTYIYMIFVCFSMFILQHHFIVTLLRYASNELKELLTYLLISILSRDVNKASSCTKVKAKAKADSATEGWDNKS